MMGETNKGAGMELTIRASGLTSYPDCLRRTAARLWPDVVQSAGFVLRELGPNIAAAIGSGTHSGAAYTLRSKMDTGELGNETEAHQRALTTMEDEVALGITYDPTSPDLNTAQKQVVRQTNAYRSQVAPLVEPVAVEVSLEANFMEGVIVTGHPDCLEPIGVNDLKTGVKRRANGFQYGAYSLLARGTGYDIQEIKEYFIPRGRITKPQPDMEIHYYDVSEAEQAAYHILHHIVESMEKFEEDGNPWSFLANPFSMLCSEKWCPAFNTDFCKSHLGAKHG